MILPGTRNVVTLTKPLGSFLGHQAFSGTNGIDDQTMPRQGLGSPLRDHASHVIFRPKRALWGVWAAYWPKGSNGAQMGPVGHPEGPRGSKVTLFY